MDAPQGVTRTPESWNPIVMPERTQPSSGWRTPTAALGLADHLAQEGEGLDIPKSRAFVAVKRVGAHIGLKAADMMLLDTLGAFTKPQDWGQGRRPLVWPSNAYLMEQTGFSLSALKRHTRRLAQAGVITFKDSANGKRWGHRDSAGHIIEAYGFDLSPLSARTEEFEALFAELQAERALCQRLRRQITVTRRMIRARIETALDEGLAGPWGSLAAAFDALLQKLPSHRATSDELHQTARAFEGLSQKVSQTFHAAISQGKDLHTSQGTIERSVNMNPKGADIEPHIQSTNELNSVTCTCLEKERAAPPDAKQNPCPATRNTCPEFLAWGKSLSARARNWGDLHRLAGHLGPMIGITEQIWNAAQRSLGREQATAALMLVFEKHAKGEVTTPAAYLRGMLRKARAGELHLTRSFMGRRHAAAP